MVIVAAAISVLVFVVENCLQVAKTHYGVFLHNKNILIGLWREKVTDRSQDNLVLEKAFCL